MDHYENIIELMRRTGPILPVQVSKTFGTNIILASAMLSDLVSQKKIRISSVKKGGSPFYYLPEHRPRLVDFAQFLNEKDRKTFDFLRGKKVVKDDRADPLTRISLRNIKDYAIPLEVTTKENKHLFWKWFLLTDDEARVLIAPYFNEPKATVVRAENPPPDKQTASEVSQVVTQKEPPEQEQPADVPVKQTATEKKPPIQKETKQEFLQQKTLFTDYDDPFFQRIKQYCNENKITICSASVIKKKKEFDCTIEIPSPVGPLKYFCKAKDKKRLNDADLAATFTGASLIHLPGLLLSPGELSKKAEKALTTYHVIVSQM